MEAPKSVDRSSFQAELEKLRVREKAHTREGDAIAAARRRLPMVEVDPTITLIGAHGPVMLLDVFEGRRQLIAYLACATLVLASLSMARAQQSGQLDRQPIEAAVQTVVVNNNVFLVSKIEGKRQVGQHEQ